MALGGLWATATRVFHVEPAKATLVALILRVCSMDDELVERPDYCVCAAGKPVCPGCAAWNRRHGVRTIRPEARADLEARIALLEERLENARAEHKLSSVQYYRKGVRSLRKRLEEFDLSEDEDGLEWQGEATENL